jgi:hypothetical protein
MPYDPPSTYASSHGGRRGVHELCGEARVLEAVTPYWWIDHISTILSVPLALIGFSIAIWQIRKTRVAAEAARSAAATALNQVQRLSLVGLLPVLTRIDDEIDRAIDVKSKEMLRFWLSQWKWHASETRGFLDAEKLEEEKVMKLIQSSVVATTDLRRELHEVDLDQLARVTVNMRKAIGKVTSELGTLAARQSTTVNGGAGD